MLSPLSPQLVEASNGVLLAILFWMIAFDALYLARKRCELGSIFTVYHECKAAIALGVTLTGFWFRAIPVWLVRHLENHGYSTSFVVGYAPAVLIGGTLLTVLGGMCWIRVITPVHCPHWGWALLTAISFAFGLWFAL